MSTAARPLGVSRFVLAGAIAVLLVLLAAPAIVVLVTSGGGDEGSGERALRVGRQPTDVAVAGNTVWIASGRDDGIVALDGRRLSRLPPGTRPAARRCDLLSARTRYGPRTRRTTPSRASTHCCRARSAVASRSEPTRSTSPSVTTARG